MIKVDRSKVPIPRVLVRGVGSPADRENEQARAYYEAEGVRQRASFQFKVQRHPTVREALTKLFNNKCAYCETPLVDQRGDIDLYRPKGGVLTAEREFLPQHYWWLANDWSNLYLSCIPCNRLVGSGPARIGKGGRFPLADETKRAPVLATSDQLALEEPLFLDPCNDFPEDYLVYTPDGMVSSDRQRGQVTIELLGLNREPLLAARREIVTEAQQLISLLDPNQPRGMTDEVLHSLIEMIADNAPYAGIARQFVLAAIDRLGLNDELADAVRSRLESTTPVRSAAVQREAKAAQVKFQQEQENYSLEDESGDALAAYVSGRDRRVERIRIRNLRAISSLDIPVDNIRQGPWLMLLGENATGKSTVLQALALALIGEEYFGELQRNFEFDLQRFVKAGTPYGEISVTLSGATEPRVLRIHSDGRLEQSGRGAQVMVLAYGSTRLLPRKEPTGHFGKTYARVENLFDPFIPLVDAQSWLMSESDERFDYAARALKKSLNISSDRILQRENGMVGLIENGAFIPLQQLCDGYQTTIALIADILEVVLRAWETPELAQGVVLIDEVGNHLHPSWKMQFVSSMREIMPGLQVIATTHEPLCLRGLFNGEVAVIRRGPRGGISIRKDLPSIEGMRVDQILTSEHFGLQSTLDPKLQAQFDRYNALLRSDAPTPAELAERDALRKQINEVQDLGKTDRERRLLEAIDKFLADKEVLETFDEIDLRERGLDEELKSIWQSVSSGALS
jgi:uncharacterized protein (TIGR02646 family)